MSGKITRVILWLLLGIALILVANQNYLLFHTLAEIFSVVIAGVIFMFAWNSRDFLKNHYFLFLGIAYLFVGLIDTLHAISYKGMGVFTWAGANLPTQMWIAARYVESISLLLAPRFLKRKTDILTTCTVYGIIVGGLLFAIFNGYFPACFIDGSGLTPFKKISEYLISLTLLGAMARLIKNRFLLHDKVLYLLTAALMTSIGAELAFTFYISVYGLSNFIGHFMRILSCYLIYKAIVVTGLKTPYDLLFRELKQSEDRYRNIYETAPLAFVVWNRECNVVDWNRHAEKIFGWSREEVLGRNFFEFLIPEGSRPQVEAVVMSLLQGTLPNYSINENLTKDGRIILCEWKNSTRYDPDGKVDGGISLGLDITKKRAAEELLKKNSEQIKLFAYSVSHDLKNPTIVIHGLAKRLLKLYQDDLDEKGRKYCTQIVRSSEELTTLVDKINSYISSGESPLRLEPLEIKEIIQSIREEFAPQLDKKRLRLIEPDHAPRIQADRLGLMRILRNLIDNSIKYGGAELSEIQVQYKETTSHHIFAVKDDGIGIKPHKSSNVFELFRREETSRGIPGAGLGLAIVKEIAAQHGGQAWVEPGQDKGIVINFSIAKDIG